MVIYLRDDNRNNLFEVEFYIKDKFVELTVNTYLESCFAYLLDDTKTKEQKEVFAKDFEELDDLRCWYYEFRGVARRLEYAVLRDELKIKFIPYCQKYGLHMVED